MSYKILILGVTGMLGNAVYRYLSNDSNFEVFGTMRSPKDKRFFSESQQKNLMAHIDVLDQDALVPLFEKIRPKLVINCVGLIKQLATVKDPLYALPMNALLPHKLANLCGLAQSRLIHISTDCVFSGNKGMYTEKDISDAEDLYGKSKYIGEVIDKPHVITLRTSIIGHELNSSHSLVDWFLSQSHQVKGFTRAIFSGLPTVELAQIIAELVIPQENLSGLYHVSVDPIDKYRLLKLIAEVYGKIIGIEVDEALCIDRSLDSSKFRQVTGYKPQAWIELIQKMKEFSLTY